MSSKSLKDLRMDAYYYSFEPTREPAIDRVLSAVACAGKAYHHTEAWTENEWFDGEPKEEHPEFGGRSCVEWIQNAANDAAKKLHAAYNQGLKDAAKVCRSSINQFHAEKRIRALMEPKEGEEK